LRVLGIEAVTGLSTYLVLVGGGKRIKQPPKPIKWLHSHAEGCVEGMVQESIMTVDKKINGERELTIADPPENSEEVQAQLNATARSAEEEAERDDESHDNVDDVDGGSGRLPIK
jgi:hypothetical protein